MEMVIAFFGNDGARGGGSVCWGLALSAHGGGELGKGRARASGFFLCRSRHLLSLIDLKESEGVWGLDKVPYVCVW